jgi:Spy/CpxP family protein refolding chaperone
MGREPTLTRALFDQEAHPMNKLVISAIAAAAIAGSAYTLSAVAATDAPEAAGPHWMAPAGFMLDAKLAGMKAALKLTPDQEKLWGPFEAAVRDGVKARREAMHAWREERESDQRPSPIAMLTEMSDHLAKASDTLKKVADAAKPLYDSLDDTQKQHFGPLLRMLHDQGPGGGWRGEHGPRGPKPL